MKLTTIIESTPTTVDSLMEPGLYSGMDVSLAPGARLPILSNGKIRPSWEGDFFLLKDIKTKSLKGSPEKVSKNYYILNQPITSLEGISKEVKGLHVARCPQLIDVSAMPIAKNYIISYCDEITSLGPLPRDINLNIQNCPKLSFTSLKPIKANHVAWRFNKDDNFKNIHEHLTHLNTLVIFVDKPFHLMDVLKIENLTKFTFETNINRNDSSHIIHIINNHLPLGLSNKKKIMACQDELIDNGFEEYL